ncbi:MAG TPA: zinc-dependent metalloprotease, partial [Chitinophagaceae bacterium]|nr:zinc-dependent metalloprotease [Chitinophagaceae bacterium]
AHLNKWVIEKLNDKRLWFGSEINLDDPRSQREQVGDDAVKGSAYGIKNLQRIVANLINWTKEPNSTYEGLRKMYSEAVGQMNWYTSHVAKYVGGIMETPKTVEQNGPVYEIVAENKQREAVEFLNRQLFATPTWIINPDIFSRTGTNPVSTIGGMQDRILSQLLSTRTLGKLIDAEAMQGNSAYQITELLSDLKKGIWSELSTRKSIDVYRRNLQKSYTISLINIIAPAPSATGSFTITLGPVSTVNTDKSDIKSVVRAHLTSLRTEIVNAIPGTPDAMSKYHLQDVANRINNALNPK